jgi:ribosomal-protein-alanine N-acetyltransferase
VKADAKRTYLRPVESRDRSEFLALMRDSKAMHAPWITPPLTERTFDLYLARTLRDDHEGYLVCRKDDDTIAGVININSIVRGSFLSASLGYYAVRTQCGRGLMAEGLGQIVQLCFGSMGLHRLEANIQPNNRRSIALVKRCGFVLEGLSRDFLYIEGGWRDHERWATYDRRDTLSP